MRHYLPKAPVFNQVMLTPPEGEELAELSRRESLVELEYLTGKHGKTTTPLMPAGKASTRDVLRFLHDEISPQTYVNIMAQYRPCGRAAEIKELSTFLSPADYQRALQDAAEEGITRLDQPRRFFNT